jgi:hypothetical protein
MGNSGSQHVFRIKFQKSGFFSGKVALLCKNWPSGNLGRRLLVIIITIDFQCTQAPELATHFFAEKLCFKFPLKYSSPITIKSLAP